MSENPIQDRNVNERLRELDEFALPKSLSDIGLTMEQVGRLASRGLVYQGVYGNADDIDSQRVIMSFIPDSPADKFARNNSASEQHSSDAFRFMREAATEDDDTFRGHYPELF